MWRYIFISLQLKIFNTKQKIVFPLHLIFQKNWKRIFYLSRAKTLLLKQTVDGEEIRRSYSICSCPLDNELRIAVKKVYDGSFSTFANQNLKRGDVLEVLPPTGTFFTEVDISNKKEYVFFAAGSGITPVISIIKTIFGPNRKVPLHWYMATGMCPR